MKKNKKKIIANIKMNGSLSFNEIYFNKIKKNFNNFENLNIGLCLPYPYLFQAKNFLEHTKICWGSQNVAKFESGPHTGEVSAPMLKDFGSKYVIVGHSERSTAYCESDENIAHKFEKIKKYNMTPVLCVGESLIEREAGIMERVVSSQIDAIVKINGAEVFEDSIIAYEPIWAIGSDTAASPAQVDKMCNFIKDHICKVFNGNFKNFSIIYGGSVNSKNAVQLFASESLDGVLVGRSSINIEEFFQICSTAENS
ncbi:triose-phosphate isomerase [Methylophilaceae bacterium]|jgi:triosephosphate isomerase|nr:triose-phosphate isomerase [Methylophilaceae bacterium]